MSASLVIESFEAPSRLVHEVFASDENSLSLGSRSSGACCEDWLFFASSCFPDACSCGACCPFWASGASIEQRAAPAPIVKATALAATAATIFVFPFMSLHPPYLNLTAQVK